MKRKGDMYSRESIYKFPTDDGDRFYSGVNRSDRKQSILNNTFSEKALLDAISKMQSSPQDSISSGNVEGYFDKKGLSKFLPFNQGGEGKVPQAPDPLQIDARMRGEFKNMGTIGAVDSNKYYSNLLNEAMQDREMLEKASFLEGYAPSEEKIEQDIFKALDYFSRKHKASPKVQGYNNGGTVGYGDQTSNVMTLEDIYAQYGQRPDDASGFQEYDVSREGGALADYSRQVSGLQQQGMGMIGKATQQAQGMGGGFAGFGGRQSAIDQTRTQAQRGYQAGVDQAQQNKFETLRSMREGYQADIIGQLAQEESMEGTSGYTKPAEVVQSLPTSDQGDVEYNGTRYVWDKQKGGYVTAQEYQQDDMSDYYDQYDYV